jgi:ADP-ribosylation factor-like protein 2
VGCIHELLGALFKNLLSGATLLVFANKQDLGGALTFEEISATLDLANEDIAGRHYKIVACSALSGEGLMEGFDWIVGDIASRIFMLS